MLNFSTVFIITILAFLAAVAGTVLSYIFIVPEKKRAQLKAFFRLIHDIFNFKFLIIEKVLQAMYIFTSLFLVCYGVLLLFGFDIYPWGGFYWHGGRGLLIAILGPIFCRLTYEGLMMLILLVKNVIQINNKLKSSDDSETNLFSVPQWEKKAAKEAAPVEAPAAEAPVAQAPRFCIKCGSVLNEDGTCPNGCE
ncbi:MAG: hypothetical protein E7462_06565 [Ruminococcaceae bacterium]|nr:hypothetical protein [Oscillospiraceae bacterium]